MAALISNIFNRHVSKQRKCCKLHCIHDGQYWKKSKQYMMATQGVLCLVDREWKQLYQGLH